MSEQLSGAESADEQDQAEAFDEEMVVGDVADDTEVTSQYPPDRYLGALDPEVTEAGQKRVETIQERVLREEPDPVVEALDREERRAERDEAAFRGAAEEPDDDPTS